MGARLRRPRLLVGLANLLAVTVLLVRALTPLADNAAVLAVTRSTAANASDQVVDLVLAADGTPRQTVDPLGRVYRTRDQTGDSVTLLRDLLGRVTQRDYRTSANWPTGTIAESDTFAFDAAGRLTSAVSGRYANTTSYAYDEFGRPITETLAYGGNSWAIGTDYDALGRAFKETQPGGAVIERTFTTRGQLHQVKRDGTTIATRSYDDGGRLSQQVFANGLTETYAYRLDDQLLSITTPGVETRSYTYDANKNVTSETITGPLSGYGWSVPSDGRNAEERLTAWNRADGNAARTWTLSPVGNWTATSLNGTSTSRTYGDVHQPLSIGGATLQYDRRGMLSRDQAGRAYAWDRRGLLASVDTDADGTAEVTYLYDALRRKVGRNEAGTTRITPQSGWRTVAEFATSAPTTPIESYAYGAYIDEPLQKVGTGGTVYYHHDRRFSVTALSDASGAAVERYAYSIHGTVGLFDGSGGSRSATALANVRMYTGVERDPTSGKDYLRNRWFEAEVGFTGRDPLGHLDGASVYHGYFSDGELDPSGLHGFINPRQVGTGSNPVTGIPNDAPLTETEKKIVDIAVTAADRADITAGHLNHFIFFGEPLISDESARGCIRDVGSGLGTGGKGVVNGLGQAGIDFISLGTYDGELVLIPVSEIDRAAGYDTSVSFAKASGEILLTLTPAKVKELKRIVDAIDAATDAKDVTIAVVDCMNEPGDSLHAAATIGRVLIGHTPCPRRVNGAVDGPGDLPTSSRSTAPDAPNTMRGAPTNLGPVGSKAPRQVTPGVRELEGHYIDDLGRSQPWRAHYDEHGRMIGRTDYNAGNRAAGIPDIHHERWEYSAQFRLGRKVENHIPGEFPQ